MAIIFAEDKDNPGGLQKVQLTKEELDTLNKSDPKNIEEGSTLTTLKEQLGDSKPTVSSEKIEIDNVGSALADQFSKLDEDTQANILSNIGLVKEKTSPKDAFKSLSEEERDEFMKKTGTKKMNLIQSAGKAFSNLADKLETNIEMVMDDPGKRALFYAGLDTIDKASRIQPIGKAQSPFGQIAGGLKTGVQRVKAEELAKANVEAKIKSADMKKQLDLLKLQFEMGKETPSETKRYENLYERNKDLAKGGKNYQSYQQMAKIYNNFITDKGSLPVGQLRSQLPVIVQNVAEILPASITSKYGKDFFTNMQDEASFVKNLNKFTNDIVLGDISQLVPVSDKDVQIKRETLPGSTDTAKVLTYSLRTQGALALLGKSKYDYIDTYRSGKGFRSGESYDKAWSTKGSTDFKNELLSSTQFTSDQIVNEAKKLGFQPDYDKYTDGKPFYSPLALAEATVSLQMGGFDKYKNVGVTGISGDGEPAPNTSTTNYGTGVIIEANPDQFLKDADQLKKDLKLNE